MSEIFSRLDSFLDRTRAVLSAYTPVDEGLDFPWENRVCESATFRRAHLDVIDLRENHKIYMLHLCVFPHTDDSAPIYGLDLIAGRNKVTGAFHDFSPTGDHPLLGWFASHTGGHEWSKERVLPEWAAAIFSPAMIAAGNVKDVEELSKFLDLAASSLTHYLNEVGKPSNEGDYLEQQNRYCKNQKQNPHTPRVMASLGFDSGLVERFIQTCLFPEI